MPPSGRRATPHDGGRGFADVGRHRMGAFVGGIMVAKDRLQGEEPYRVLLDRYVKVRMFYFIRLEHAFPALR